MRYLQYNYGISYPPFSPASGETQFGWGSTANALNATVFGNDAIANGVNGIALGQGTLAGANDFSVGWHATTTGHGSFAWGWQANDGGFNNAFAFGDSVTATANNTMFLGSLGNPIRLNVSSNISGTGLSLTRSDSSPVVSSMTASDGTAWTFTVYGTTNGPDFPSELQFVANGTRIIGTSTNSGGVFGVWAANNTFYGNMEIKTNLYVDGDLHIVGGQAYGNGGSLTNLNPSTAFGSGTVPYGVLPSGVLTNNEASAVTLAASLSTGANVISGNGSGLTNIQGSAFPITTATAVNQVTNFTLTFGSAPYYTFAASTNLYFTATSGGPGPVSWWITNSGAAGLIISVYFPTNALAGYTNDCTITGTNWIINLTNTSSGRVLFLSAFKYGSANTFNDVVWNHIVTLP